MKIKVIIVEDETHSQELLRNFLTNYCRDVLVVGSSKTVRDAITLINKLSPDVVFLDIELEDGNGFDVLQKFSDFDFLTILITGYDDFGIKAVKHSVFDYILKPYSIKELKEVISRAKSRLNIWNVFDEIEKKNSEAFLSEDKLVLRLNKKTHILSMEEIIFIEVDNPYCKIHLASGERIYIQSTLKKMSEILPDFFYRIHRSYLINLTKVKSWDNGRGGEITLVNEFNLPVAYRAKKEFKKRVIKFV